MTIYWQGHFSVVELDGYMILVISKILFHLMMLLVIKYMVVYYMVVYYMVNMLLLVEDLASF